MRPKRPPVEDLIHMEEVRGAKLKNLVADTLKEGDEPLHETEAPAETTDAAPEADLSENGRPSYEVQRGKYGELILRAKVTTQQQYQQFLYLQAAKNHRTEALRLYELAKAVCSKEVTPEILTIYPELEGFNRNEAAKILERKARREERRWAEAQKLAEEASSPRWIRVIMPPAKIYSVGQWGGKGGGGGGAGGGGAGKAPKQGGDGRIRQYPHLPPGWTDPNAIMNQRLAKALSFGQTRYDGREIIGGGSGSGKRALRRMAKVVRAPEIIPQHGKKRGKTRAKAE